MFKKKHLIFLFISLIISLGGLFYWQNDFFTQPPQPQTIQIKNSLFKIELAQTPRQRATGLMYRSTLPRNAGMFFVYSNNANHGPFWMKNTLISLDILFIDNNDRIVSIIEQAIPCPPKATTCPTYPSQQAYQYVLEINGGIVKEKSFAIGDLVIRQGIEISE